MTIINHTISWQERALELYNTENLSKKEITNIIEKEFGLQNMYDSVYGQIRRHGNHLSHAVYAHESAEKRVVVQNQEPKHVTSKWDGTKTIKFAIIGDTQIGSKYAQLTYLHEFYDLCKKEGIKSVYHAGDLVDGLKMRTGHEYELCDVSADDMRDDVIKN